MSTFSQQVASLELIPGAGGAFEVTVDGQQVYSKKETKRFPELRELMQIVKPHLPD